MRWQHVNGVCQEAMEIEQVGANDMEASAHAGRAATYRILAGLLCAAPSTRMLQHLNSMPMRAGQRDGITDAFYSLSEAAASATMEDIADEYQGLFIGVGRGEIVPYESFYLTGFLMDKRLSELRAAMVDLGYSRQEGVKEPEDHIASLFEMMGLMITDEVSFMRQRRFFNAHIAPWAERLFDDISATESAVFYTKVAELGLAFMAFESSYFAMTV